MREKIRIITFVRYAMVFGLLVCAVYLQSGNKISTTPFETVKNQILTVCSFETMPAENRMLRRLYGLNASDYDSVVLYSPTSNMDVQEMLLIRLKDVSQSESVVAAMESRLATQLDSFEGYGVEQTKLLEDSVLQAEGNYILFLVHPDAARGLQVFKSSL